MQNTMPKPKPLYIVYLLLCVMIAAGCIRQNLAEAGHGRLDLSFRFSMKNYPMVKDSLCGCTQSGHELAAYRSPGITIRDEQGRKVYEAYSLEIILEGYPLQEGKYTAQYRANLVDYKVCDSAHDIWSLTTYDGTQVFCVHKNKFNYKSLDTTEHFEIRRGQATVLSRYY